MKNTQIIGIVLLCLAIIAIIGVITYYRKPITNKCKELTDKIKNKTDTTDTNNTDNTNKENFISSGTNGAYYDEENNAIRGSHLYSNQMISNGNIWDDVVKTAKEKRIASDGRGMLGAGPGDGFEKAWESQRKISEAWSDVNNNYMTNEEFNALAKEVATTASPQSDNSLLNRGNQTRGKLSVLPDKLVCVIDEKYLPERDKNYTVYKTNSIVHVQGYDIDTNRIGSELLDTDFPKYVKKSRGKRNITSTGATTDGLKVVETDDKDSTVEGFKSRFINKNGTIEKFTGNSEIKVVQADDGSNWYSRNNGQVKVF